MINFIIINWELTYTHVINFYDVKRNWKKKKNSKWTENLTPLDPKQFIHLSSPFIG